MAKRTGAEPATKPTEDSTYPGSAELYSRIVDIGRDLAASFGSLVESLPGSPTATKQLAECLGVDKVLSHRLLTAVRKPDPLATAHAIPGPEPLLRVVRAARKRGVPRGILDSAEEVTGRFRDLIRNEAGDRSGLDAIISASLPDARARFETDAKQLSFRAMRQLRGVAADSGFTTMMIHLRPEQERGDIVLLTGFLGLRCVRPGASVTINVISGVENQTPQQYTLDGEPIMDARQAFLPEFCTEPPDVERFQTGHFEVYSVAWNDRVGLRSAGDLVTANVIKNTMRMHRKPDDPLPFVGGCDAFSIPVKKHVSDILLHDDVFPDAQPRTRIYDMGELGIAAVNDKHRDSDILDITAETKLLGRGIGRFRIEEVPFYVELLTHVCTKLGYDPAAFRCFRTRMDYPIHGTELQVAFELPLEPTP